MPHHYHETPFMFDACYCQQALAYQATRTVPEHEVRSEQPIRLSRVASCIAMAAVLAIGILGVAEMLSAEPSTAAVHSTPSIAINATSKG